MKNWSAALPLAQELVRLTSEYNPEYAECKALLEQIEAALRAEPQQKARAEEQSR